MPLKGLHTNIILYSGEMALWCTLWWQTINTFTAENSNNDISRQNVTVDSVVPTTNAFVSCHLDYYSSLFRSMSSLNQCRLEFNQGTLARIVTKHNRYIRATSILKSPHWLNTVMCSIWVKVQVDLYIS